MPVYVNDVRHRFGRMSICHLWADTVDELQAFAARLGLQRRWFQCPPKASWEHYDISLGVKTKAIELGAVLTDKYGPLEHEARQRGDQRKRLFRSQTLCPRDRQRVFPATRNPVARSRRQLYNVSYCRCYGFSSHFKGGFRVANSVWDIY